MSTILLIPLSLLLALSMLRRVVDPACPRCASKSWGDDPAALRCTRCGWSNVAPAAPAGAAPEPQPQAPQYEFRLHG